MGHVVQLYELLRDRSSINALKVLYDQEFVFKTAHTMPLDVLASRIGLTPEGFASTAGNLIDSGLIAKEESPDNGVILSLRAKGKKFVERFDMLRDVFADKIEKEEQQYFKIDYDLSDSENRLVILCYKMQSELGGSVLLRTLAQEAYPHKEASKVLGAVSKQVSKLVGLNLLKREENDDGVLLEVTSSGERLVKNQLLEKVPKPF
jgi:DNA-binding MarR family transcriptional regulator